MRLIMLVAARRKLVAITQSTISLLLFVLVKPKIVECFIIYLSTSEEFEHVSLPQN